jgi:N-methylhydantoinase B
VLFDVEAGLVSAAGAKRYGVVITNDALDEAATKVLREKIAKDRGPKQLFNRGFDSIEELKARCQKETGLPPPAAPQFTQWARRLAGAPR